MPEIRDLAPYEGRPERQPIQFRSVQKTEIVDHWPEFTSMSLSLLREQNAYGISVNRKGQIVITFDNGWARYKLADIQDGYDSLNLELIASRP